MSCCNTLRDCLHEPSFGLCTFDITLHLREILSRHSNHHHNHPISPVPTMVRVPFPPNSNFVGRKDILAEIEFIFFFFFQQTRRQSFEHWKTVDRLSPFSVIFFGNPPLKCHLSSHITWILTQQPPFFPRLKPRANVFGQVLVVIDLDVELLG